MLLQNLLAGNVFLPAKVKDVPLAENNGTLSKSPLEVFSMAILMQVSHELAELKRQRHFTVRRSDAVLDRFRQSALMPVD